MGRWPMNLSRWIEQAVSSSGATEACRTIELRRRADAFADARLLFDRADWAFTPAGRDLLDVLRKSPEVAVVEARRAALSLRFDDGVVEALGERLESGEDAALDGDDLLAGEKYMVGFVGPNTSKALHVGHLRNIAVGHALASAYAAAGAQVIRQSLVGDIGRSTCEAMAGLQLRPNDAPEPRGLKPDHFVGACYAEYVREGRAGVDGAADPVSREVSAGEDAADRLMRAWRAGDPEAHALWHRMRGWTLEGHRVTLERLGVRIDHCDFESDAMGDIDALLDRGLGEGILARGAAGEVTYESGRAELSTMVLARSDGFPTEHARLLAVLLRMEAARRGRYTCIDLVGSEWQPTSALHEELLRKLRPEGDHDSHQHVFHGMVTASLSKISSAQGTALLIDDLLDRLVEEPRVRAIAALAGGAVDAATIAAIVAKGYFLCRPVAKPMEFSWEHLLERERSPGWAIASAWSKAASEPVSSRAAEASRAERRLLVVRAQDFRRSLRHATGEPSISALTSYLQHVCDVVLAASEEPRYARLARSVLRTTMGSLGLLP